MPFQPFGYSFNFRSPMSPADVKAVIRSRKTTWLDTKNGARGWIAGPLICLWFNALDSHGPMLLGWISADGSGATVTGRAGADLNGLAIALILPLLSTLLLLTIAFGGGRWQVTIPLLGFMLFVAAMVLLSSHLFRRDAEPLMRFVRDTIATSASPPRKKPVPADITRTLKLNVSGNDREGAATWDDIHDALLGIGADDFVILQSDPDNFIQTLSHDGSGYVLEMHEGEGSRHFEGAHDHATVEEMDYSSRVFTCEEVVEVFLAYASGRPMPRFLRWQPVKLTGWLS